MFTGTRYHSSIYILDIVKVLFDTVPKNIKTIKLKHKTDSKIVVFLLKKIIRKVEKFLEKGCLYVNVNHTN